jgi:hypothetical protein
MKKENYETKRDASAVLLSDILQPRDILAHGVTGLSVLLPQRPGAASREDVWRRYTGAALRICVYLLHRMRAWVVPAIIQFGVPRCQGNFVLNHGAGWR